MKRLTAIVLVLTASACAPAAGPAAAQDPAPTPLRTLDVSADATVMRAPDRATVRLAVETVARTARGATQGNAETMTAVMDALTGLGIDESDVRTENLSLNPRYQRSPGSEEPAITGYQATNQVSVRLDDTDQVGRVVDAAIGAGANRVAGIQFEISDPEAAYHEALETAVAKARREAEVLARAMGETLGPAIHVTTNGGAGPMPRFYAAGAARAESMATPVQPGELEVRASVRITYRLEP